MRLPEFILLVTATVAAIAAGLAVLASKYSIARVLFWITALSFGSLGVVWSATSVGYSLPTQLSVSAIIGAIAAAGLTRGLWEVRQKERAEVPASKSGSLPSARRGPTLEATNRSKIDATGAVIPGDLPFQFGRAENDSIIHMPGIQVLKNEDSTYTVIPGAAPLQFPLPTGEFSRLSNPALNQKVQGVILELRQFNSNYRRDVFPPYTKVGPIDEEYTQRSTENWNKYRESYEEKFFKTCIVANLGNARPHWRNRFYATIRRRGGDYRVLRKICGS